MKYYITIIILFFAISFNAQSRKDKKIYLDSIGTQTTVGTHKYFRIIKGYYLEKEKYEVIDYYLDNQIKAEGIFKNKYLNYPIGEYKKYYPSGKLQSIRKISTSDLGSDVFYSFHENGNKEIEGEYLKIKNGDKIDCNLKVTSYWTEDNIQKVIDGEGFMVQKDDFETSSGTIKLGLKDGVWEGINTIHKISFKDKYNFGIFIDGTSKNETNEEFHYIIVNQAAEFQDGSKKFTKFIEKYFTLPFIEKSFKGKMIISFVVGIDGNFRDLKVLESVIKECDIEGINLIKATQGMWKPSIFRGIKTKYKLLQSINIESTFISENR